MSPSGDDSNDGSVLSPLLTIGTAVALSTNGDTIVLKSGVYSGPLNTNVVISKRLLLRSETSNPSDVVIDAAGSGSVFLIQRVPSLANPNIDDIGDLHIQGLNISSGVHFKGGGFSIAHSFVSIHHCIFWRCQATRGGAIFHGPNSRLKIRDSMFFGNRAFNGGGIFAESELLVERSEFLGQFSTSDGSNCFCTGASCLFKESLVSESVSSNSF